MGKTDFDNLLKMIKVDLDALTNVAQSIEIDFELPRGFIAKIKKIFLGSNGFLAAVGFNEIQIALLRDPDDTTTVTVPDNTVQHDVVEAIEFALDRGTVTTGTIRSQTGQVNSVLTFDEGEDVITARNMRFNGIAGFATAVVGAVTCKIWYTLEKVTDADILDLLDIL